MPETEPASVIPAQLSSLAIYNPLLGPTDETFHDQIVFYSSKATRLRRTASDAAEVASSAHKDDRNERLRQIGLAQGMVSFAKNFSEGQAVDSVETEKSRIVLHEVEKNWWILASVDLTRLPSGAASGSPSASTTRRVDYSSREICAPQLLVQQLRRAHSIFLLHHDATLDDLYKRVGRSTFCSLLDRFWTQFAWNWDILLSGNPAVDIYNGIKLAAGGELGIGVGEEEWGSGEREVLEDFVSRTDGLIDLVASRFGDGASQNQGSPSPKNKPGYSDAQTDELPWLGSDTCPRPSDGVIFSGVGAISRSSLTQVSQWMEWIYRYGEAAYGVNENPGSIRRRKQRKRRGRPSTRDPAVLHETGLGASMDTSQVQAPNQSLSPGIPPPLVTATPQATQTFSGKEVSRGSSKSTGTGSETVDDSSAFGADNLMKYLTLGYGSSWGFPSLYAPSHPRVSSLRQDGSRSDANRDSSPAAMASGITSERPARKERKRDKYGDDAVGKFIIGLRDDLEDEDTDDEGIEDSDAGRNSEARGSRNNRTMLRTLHIQMATSVGYESMEDTSPENAYRRMQVVIYVHRPFMFTFLFELRTPTLVHPAFYRSIHHQLGPLQKPLLSSTSPANISQRLSISGVAANPRRSSAANQPIYDFVYDPSNLTIRSSIPNIPEPGTFAAEGLTSQDPNTPAWSRVEAINVHHRILTTYIETRLRALEVERTCKTSRGWWVVWVRIPNSPEESGQETITPGNGGAPKEAFLIRKASDYATAPGHARNASGSRFFRDLSGASSVGSQSGSGNMTSGKLAEGVGLDARRYIESLVGLNR